MSEAKSLPDVLAQQTRALDEFENNTSKSLAVSDALNYLEYWEQTTSQKLVPFLSPSDIQKLKAVWLEQQFELAADQQLAGLIKKFHTVLVELKSLSPE